jgi:alkanesulfonate monooxygenase SsuD/methylene tetrahydromethanopterin reductase-like flavin-dependent oxidoreductase (luciferase family)
MNGYWERRTALGADDNPHSAAFFQQVCISETDAQCEKEWWPHVDYFFNKCLHLYPGTSEAPGYRSEASLRAGIVAQFGNTTQNMGIDKTWKQLVNEGYILAGSPETVRQQIEELGKTLRVGHVLLGCQIGSAPAELVNRATKLAGDQILPKLRHLYSDYEDRWWPKALPASRRAKPGAHNPVSAGVGP